MADNGAGAGRLGLDDSEGASERLSGDFVQDSDTVERVILNAVKNLTVRKPPR